METGDDLTIPFPFPDPEGNRTGFDYEWAEARAQRRNKFWDSPTTFEWFKARGYTLYERIPDEDPWTTIPRTADDKSFVSAKYPYASHDPYSSGRRPSRCGRLTRGSVVFAQDEQNRHVAIKLVPKDGRDELKIYEFIHRQDLKTLQENSILPVLEILYIKSHCFVVMPRWGTGIVPNGTGYQSRREVLTLVHSLLKGMKFLHEHGIAHRDLVFPNILCNHFTDMIEGGHDRTILRANGQLLFGIYDFDISIMVPPGTDRSKFRLPYQYNWQGSVWVYDVDQGELEYDPFAYDVRCLGLYLLSYHRTFHQVIPLLTPLFDSMTTRDVSRRFTASQALDFLEVEMANMSDADLSKPVTHCLKHGCDSYAHLPPEVAKKWAIYKDEPPSLSTRVLRWLCSIESFDFTRYVRAVRRLDRSFRSFPGIFFLSKYLGSQKNSVVERNL